MSNIGHEGNDGTTMTQERAQRILIKIRKLHSLRSVQKFNTQFKQILSILWVS